MEISAIMNEAKHVIWQAYYNFPFDLVPMIGIADLQGTQMLSLVGAE